jgi:hypothetical protein
MKLEPVLRRSASRSSSSVQNASAAAEFIGTFIAVGARAETYWRLIP